MPAISIKFDLPRLQAALKNKLALTKKTEVEIVNKASLDIAFRAASFTPKAQTSAIRNRLLSNGLLPALAATACNIKYGKRQWNRTQWREMCVHILAARRRGLGAIRAGWIPAIQNLGGNYRGAKLRGDGTAASGYGLRANIQNLSSVIVNSVEVKDHKGKPYGPGDIALAVQALERAIEFVTDDIEGYATRKLLARMKEISD